LLTRAPCHCVISLSRLFNILSFSYIIPSPSFVRFALTKQIPLPLNIKLAIHLGCYLFHTLKSFYTTTSCHYNVTHSCWNCKMSKLMSMHCVLKAIVWTLAKLSEVHCSLQGLLPSEFQFNYECDGGAINKSIHTLIIKFEASI
jgi:hypothetical protein